MGRNQLKTKKKKKGTDWRTPGYEKCKWQEEQLWQDSDEPAYFAYFKPEIEEVAIKMVRDYRLPESCLDDLISDGTLALARVPKENRWSGPYVYRCIVNRMRDGLQQAKTRWSRFELWAEVPDIIHAPDGIDGRIEMREMTSKLAGVSKRVIDLYLQGYDQREIAVKLRLSQTTVKTAWEGAVTSIRKRINPAEDTQTCQPISTDR